MKRPSRRQFLQGAGALGALGGAKAADNVLLGYGVVVGENLHTQDLDELVAENAVGSRAVTDRVRVEGDSLLVDGEPAVALDGDPSMARAVEREHDLPAGALAQPVADLPLSPDEFAFSTSEPFFERVGAAESRPYTTAALRGYFSDVAPRLVEDVAGAPPTRPRAVAEGLVEGFREHSFYDVPRYLAGSVEDNVLFGTVDLRRFFESPVDFGAVADGDTTGLFCYELVYRSIEAFHAAHPADQRVPVAGAVVFDDRHKHVYTGLASVVREDGDLAVPMTFLDYTHSTLYDDLALRGVLGEGLEAYDSRHRATAVYWSAA